MPKRRAFYSFHYQPDSSRASQVRNLGVVEGNRPATDNQWEAVKRGGDTRIRQWINDQLEGKSVAIVLVGANTAGRKWIDYEIVEAWNRGKGLLGVHIHNLKDFRGRTAKKGASPFRGIHVGNRSMAGIVPLHDPPYVDSKRVYAYIGANLADWIEEAIEIRKRHG